MQTTLTSSSICPSHQTCRDTCIFPSVIGAVPAILQGSILRPLTRVLVDTQPIAFLENPVLSHDRRQLKSRQRIVGFVIQLLHSPFLLVFCLSGFIQTILVFSALFLQVVFGADSDIESRDA